MKKALVSTLALAALVAIALVAGRAAAAPAATQDANLTGTGSSFVFPLVSKWIPELGKAYGINLTYSPTGSGAGIAAVTARSVTIIALFHFLCRYQSVSTDDPNV